MDLQGISFKSIPARTSLVMKHSVTQNECFCDSLPQQYVTVQVGYWLTYISVLVSVLVLHYKTLYKDTIHTCVYKCMYVYIYTRHSTQTLIPSTYIIERWISYASDCTAFFVLLFSEYYIFCNNVTLNLTLCLHVWRVQQRKKYTHSDT